MHVVVLPLRKSLRWCWGDAGASPSRLDLKWSPPSRLWSWSTATGVDSCPDEGCPRGRRRNPSCEHVWPAECAVTKHTRYVGTTRTASVSPIHVDRPTDEGIEADSPSVQLTVLPCPLYPRTRAPSSPRSHCRSRSCPRPRQLTSTLMPKPVLDWTSASPTDATSLLSLRTHALSQNTQGKQNTLIHQLEIGDPK